MSAPLTKSERIAAIAMAREIVAHGPGFLRVDSSYDIARLVIVLIDRGQRIMPAYAALLEFARAVRDGKSSHVEYMAFRKQALEALRVEEIDTASSEGDVQ